MTEEPAGPRVPSRREGPPAPVSRRLEEREVAEILRRAAAVDVSAAAGDGPTLPELMAAAAEAGLDPSEVRRAAALLDDTRADGGAARLLLGAPDRRERRAFLPEASLPRSPDAVVRVVERTLGRPGDVERGPGLLRWNERGGGTRVELRAGSGGLEVCLVADRARRYLGHWFAGLVGWAALSALTPLGAVLGLPATLIGFVVTPPLLVRPLWRHADRVARLELERLAMDVLRAVEEGAPAGEPDVDDRGAG